MADSEGIRCARLERAEKALIDAGWTYKEGAAAWKPPLGKKPDFVDPSALVFALEQARMTLSRLLDGRVDPEGLDCMVDIDNLLAYLDKPEWQFPKTNIGAGTHGVNKTIYDIGHQSLASDTP